MDEDLAKLTQAAVADWNALTFCFALPISPVVELTTPELRKFAEVFYTNIHRVSSLCDLPNSVWMNARDYERHRWAPDDDSPLAAPAGEFLTKNTFGVLWYAKACRAILESCIAGVWTAFESLAADLWEEAVNLRPEPLALSVITTQPKKSDSEDSDAPGGGQGKSPKLRFIESLIGSDLEAANELGGLLRFARRVEFNSLHGIREAYRTAFGDDAEALFTSPAGTDLEVVHGVRNVLVHAGGNVDRAYRQRVKKNRAVYEKFELADLELRARLPLKAVSVAKFVQAVIESSVGLMRFVDKWFVDHPT
jgi:hypothetical protein